jgi:RNA polymerase sigma-70 factor, ECF subfamily
MVAKTLATSPCVSDEVPDSEVIAAVRAGDTSQFEVLVRRYQPRIFATVRRYSRQEREVEDIVQEIFLKAFTKLDSWRGEAPFEHWLMRLAVRTCYDVLRSHQRNREHAVSELNDDEGSWLERQAAPASGETDSTAAQSLIARVLDQMSPAHRLVITLLELEERSIKEIAELTGWSVPLVKVRAFRARSEMKKILTRMEVEKYL